MSDPAIALLEFDSISAGIVAGDAMVKASPIASLHAGSVQPGNYLVLARGDTASVEIALEAGREMGEAHLIDTVFLPDIHPAVGAAMVHDGSRLEFQGEALGIVETASVAAVIDAADAGAKAAEVTVSSVRMADGLGGKGYVLFTGVLAEVEAAVEAAVDRIGAGGTLIRSDVIAQIHDEMSANLIADPMFARRIRSGS